MPLEVPPLPILRLQPILTALAATAVVVVLWVGGLFETPERASLVGRLLLRGPLPVPPDITLVVIDEASLAKYGQMPWDRRRFAALVDRLHRDGARAIGLDVAFNEPARNPAEDDALAGAIARAGNVVLPAYRAYLGSGGNTTLFKPLPRYERAAAGLGLAQFTTAQEFMYLALEPLQMEGHTLLPVMGLALARTAGWPVKTVAPGYLNPMGPAHHFKETSFADALAAPPGTFRNQVVLVGATAAGLPDTGFIGPFVARGPISGVELHATSLANLTRTGRLHRWPTPASWALLALLGILPGAWLASDRPVPMRRRLAWLAGSLVALGAIAQGLLLAGWWVELVPGVSLVTMTFVAGLASQQVRLMGDRARMLARYAGDLAIEAKHERERIDGELHDEAQQLLIALNRDLRKVRKLLETDPQEASSRLQEAEGLGKRILDEVMRVRKDLMPQTLSRAGLRAAVEEMATDYARRVEGLSIQVDLGDWNPDLDTVLESELYWLIKESLNNAVKHAQAGRIRLKLERRGRYVMMGVADDGRGFRVPALDREPTGPEHSGLHRMWLRAQALGGRLAIESAPGHGTRLELSVPVGGTGR